MWQADKKQEMEDRKQVQALYTDLVDAVKMRDLNKKVSWYRGSAGDVLPQLDWVAKHPIII